MSTSSRREEERGWTRQELYFLEGGKEFTSWGRIVEIIDFMRAEGFRRESGVKWGLLAELHIVVEIQWHQFHVWCCLEGNCHHCYQLLLISWNCHDFEVNNFGLLVARATVMRVLCEARGDCLRPLFDPEVVTRLYYPSICVLARHHHMSPRFKWYPHVEWRLVQPGMSILSIYNVIILARFSNNFRNKDM